MQTQLSEVLARSRARQARRQAVLEAYGSDNYEWTPVSIAALSYLLCVIALQFPNAHKFAPLDYAVVTNKDSVDLKAWVNQSSPVLVPAGSIIIIDDFPAIWSLMLENLDSATATTLGDVVVTFRKSPMSADKLSRMQVSP